jgi:hypothetical protein
LLGIVTRFITAVFITIIAIVGIYAILVFPRVATDFSVSFTVGADREEREFEMPLLHDKVQIQVIIDSGSTLWRARILDSDENENWEHTKVQGEQTSYTSDWIDLPSGRYNFIFGTVGIGDLQANVKVTTKGGFW